MKTFTRIWLGIALFAIGIGTILLIITGISGVSIPYLATVSYQDTYSDVTSIDMEITFGEVKIIEGDTFSIKGERVPENSLESYVDEDGTWVIRQNMDHMNLVDFMGLDLSVGNFLHWKGARTSTITITVPHNFVADDISVEIKAGEVEAERILAETGSFHVSTGRLVIDELDIDEESDYRIGAGSMLLNKVSVKNITVDCGVGEVVIRGKVIGDNEVSCDIGSVEMYLEGEKDDYSYDISASIGNIDIDNNSYHGISERYINNDDTDNSIALNCDIGNISIDFY